MLNSINNQNKEVKSRLFSGLNTIKTQNEKVKSRSFTGMNTINNQNHPENSGVKSRIFTAGTRRIITTLLITTIGFAAFSQQVDSDIYFLEFNIAKDGKYSFAPPFNFTKRKGYDNQPSFSANGEHVYFVSYKDTIQSDVYDYSIYDSTTIAVTNTPESEFSPMITPDGQHLSIIRMEMDKKQRMYQVLLDGNEPEQVIYTTDSAAYYDWINEKNVAMVVLDKTMMLHIYETPGEQFIQLAKNVGRCVKKIPNTESVSYLTKDDTTGYTMLTFNIITGEMGSTFKMPKGVEDFAWTNEGKLICGSSGKLLMLDPLKPDGGWVELADFSKSIGEFYRIAISPRGNRWAVVGYKGKKP